MRGAERSGNSEAVGRESGRSVDDAPRLADDLPAAEPCALILFAHGSRDPQWAEPFRAIQRSVAERKPALTVELAFLEVMKPTLPEAVERLIASGRSRLTIAPLFMAQGAHLKRDLAEILAKLRDRHPAIDIALLPSLGESVEIVSAISAWLGAHA